MSFQEKTLFTRIIHLNSKITWEWTERVVQMQSRLIF